MASVTPDPEHAALVRSATDGNSWCGCVALDNLEGTRRCRAHADPDASPPLDHEVIDIVLVHGNQTLMIFAEPPQQPLRQQDGIVLKV
jgi:hypothetical protein